MADWEKIEKDFEANEMSFEDFRNETIRLIWTDDMQGLQRLCDTQIVTPIFFVEKVIEEIQPGNQWNDVLYLMAKELIKAAPHMVGHFESQLKGKRRLVPNPNGGKAVLDSVINVELAPNEFLERVKIILGTINFMGLDDLVIKNPTNARAFVRQMLDQSPDMKRNPRMHQFLCEMARAYQNHHHDSGPLKMIKDRAGSLNFLIDDDDDAGQVMISQGTDSLHKLDETARQAKILFVKQDYSGAKAIYRDLIPKMNMLYATASPMSSSTGGLSDNVPADMTSEYENALMFYAVLLAMEGEEAEAQQVFTQCMEKGFRYGDLLFFSVGEIRENRRMIDNGTRKVMNDKAEKLNFDAFFTLVTGHSYLKINRMFDRFFRMVGDRDLEAAFSLSKELLEAYKKNRNVLVQFSLCEYIVHVFQACFLVLKGKTSEAHRLYQLAFKDKVDPKDLERNFNNISNNPGKVMAHYFGK